MNDPTSRTADSTVDMHQIGEVATRVDLSLRTVRYYEEMGLIFPEKRTDGGFRLYTDQNIDRLLTIKQVKPLGFTLQEMRELLDARDTFELLEPDDPKRQLAAERLSQFARVADERCDKLRRHLAAGEDLVQQLRRESRQERGY